MKLARKFTVQNQDFKAICTATNLHVKVPSGGHLHYPVSKYDESQRKQIFESRVPEYMADGDFGEASRLVMNIEAGVIQ